MITSLREINCILKKIVATKDEFGRNSTRGDDLIIGPRVTWNEMRFVDKSMEFLSHVRVQRFVIDMLFLIQHHIFLYLLFRRVKKSFNDYFDVHLSVKIHNWNGEKYNC